MTYKYLWPIGCKTFTSAVWLTHVGRLRLPLGNIFYLKQDMWNTHPIILFDWMCFSPKFHVHCWSIDDPWACSWYVLTALLLVTFATFAQMWLVEASSSTPLISCGFLRTWGAMSWAGWQMYVGISFSATRVQFASPAPSKILLKSVTLCNDNWYGAAGVYHADLVDPDAGRLCDPDTDHPSDPDAGRPSNPGDPFVPGASYPYFCSLQATFWGY